MSQLLLRQTLEANGDELSEYRIAMIDDSTVNLSRNDLPAACRSAADTSARGQRRTKLLVRVELLAIVGAGIAGLQSLRIGGARLDLLAAIAGFLFVVSLATLSYRALSNPEQRWYSGRAGAESIRTLAWRYATGGNPFPKNKDETTAETKFLDRLKEVLGQLEELELNPTDVNDTELTDSMQAVRAASLAQRREIYKRDRIINQIEWYSKKCKAHRRSANLWLVISASASAIGLLVAALRFFNVIDVDLLGVAGACASAAIAWNQLNQNRALVSAYGLTCRELNLIRDRINLVPDFEWASFVSDAEDAISREHTMWLARHGHPVIQRRNSNI